MTKPAETIAPPGKTPRRRREQKGEAYVWLSGGTLATGVVMILGMLLLILVEGGSTFWPGDIEKFTLGDGSVILGTVHGTRPLDVRDLPLKEDGSRWQAWELDEEPVEYLVRRGNQDDAFAEKKDAFTWVKLDVPDLEAYEKQNPQGYASCVVEREAVSGVALVERLEKGVLTGWVVEVSVDGEVLASREKDGDEKVWEVFTEQQQQMRAHWLERHRVEKNDLGDVQTRLTRLQEKLLRVRYDHRDSPEATAALDALKGVYEEWSRQEPLPDPELGEEDFAAKAETWRGELPALLDRWEEESGRLDLSDAERRALSEARAINEQRADIQSGDYAKLRFQARRMADKEKTALYTLETVDGQRGVFPLAQVVRAHRPNEMGFSERLSVYWDRISEFLTDEPREANTEGGIFMVIVGTLVMTLLMCVAVVPFGVIAALYLREYARQGVVVSAVRIAVNNLAGVPSIVFGIFGLGFFCVLVGGTFDKLFFPELLPSPTFGGGGILWASLTLALLTVPVVIVSTEEALAAVPSSQREASLGAGASKFQTIWKVVLPQALPGILTGAILAMARGAGEVAPLMLVGAVKYAPYAPVDGTAPFVHLERKFMHLGFHIYDVGFQSPNVDNTKPLVFATALVLIFLVAVLNIFAIWLRNRLRRKYRTSAV